MNKELIVGPFPSHLSRKEKEEFLLHFKAVQVSHVLHKNREKYAIARFEDSRAVEDALKRIHQLKLFGKRISAKFYDERKLLPPSSQATFMNNGDPEELDEKLRALYNFEAQLSGISTKFGIYNPISPKLRYAYADPTPHVLCNIAHALVAVPKFYTQVLHLMNKMNLPCPFGSLTVEPPLVKEAKKKTKIFCVCGDESARNTSSVVAGNTSEKQIETETESELESDEETKHALNKEKQNLPKRIISRKKRINKKPKLEDLKQSFLSSKDTSTLEPRDDSLALKTMFEMPNINMKRTLNVKVQNELPEQINSSQEVVTEGFGKLYPSSKNVDISKKSEPFISLEELNSNKIPESDWPIVPVFKNYNAGSPSNRLYIKNLAKAVTENDLKFIFGRYTSTPSEDSEDDSPKLHIRLMKEGRMKGQAFITFHSDEVAAKALNDVNGFIFKDKPMVIVFGKVKPVD